jgi:putative transposase
MGRLTTPETKASNPGNQLEDFVREHVQQFIQALLEEEVTELLGRTKSARREVVDAVPEYRNGYGKPRGLPLTNGTITVRRPRVCDLSGLSVECCRCSSDRPREVGELLPLAP